MQNDDLESWEYQALAEFRYEIRSFMHFSERAVRTAGLSLQQHQLLLAIKGIGPEDEPTIGYLAERLQIRHHSAVELIDRLSSVGLVQRERDLVDKRRVRITITRSGSARLRKLAIAHQAELQSVAPKLMRTLQRLIAGRRHEKQSAGTGA